MVRLRVVVDSSVIVSGLQRPNGPRGRLVTQLVADRTVDLLLPDQVIREVRVSIASAIADDHRVAARFEALVRASEHLTDPAVVAAHTRDPSDDAIVQAALDGRADLIATADLDIAPWPRGTRYWSSDGHVVEAVQVAQGLVILEERGRRD